MTSVAAVQFGILWAQSDPVTAISIIVGTLVAALGSVVGLRSYQAKRQVDRVTIGLTSLEGALARADKDRDTQDRQHSADLARIELMHGQAMASLEQRITLLVAAHEADNERCDLKLRRLGHIVKKLGGEVPDDLNGLNAA